MTDRCTLGHSATPIHGPSRDGAPSVSSKLLGHLVLALGRHVRQLHEEGHKAPREIEELTALVTFLVNVRHHPPSLAGEFGTNHHARMSNRLVLSKSEAAERLGISVRSIERLVAGGRLPQVQVGGLARVRVSDLEAFVNDLSPHAASPIDERRADHPGSRMFRTQPNDRSA